MNENELLYNLINDDLIASSFQTLGQYRSMLLKEINKQKIKKICKNCKYFIKNVNISTLQKNTYNKNWKSPCNFLNNRKNLDKYIHQSGSSSNLVKLRKKNIFGKNCYDNRADSSKDDLTIFVNENFGCKFFKQKKQK